VSLGVICTICYSYGGLSETAIKPLYRIYFMQVRSSTGLISHKRCHETPRRAHRTASRPTRTVGNWTFRPFVSSPPGRLNRFPVYSVKTHMISFRSFRSILFTTARRTIF